MKGAGRTSTYMSTTVFLWSLGKQQSLGQNPRPTCQLLSDPGQVWLLISPEGKGQKERHGSFSMTGSVMYKGTKAGMGFA